MEEKSPRKTSTRTRTKADTASPRKTTPRKRATTTRRPAGAAESAAPARASVRKAPTRTTATKNSGRPIMAYVSVAGFLLVLGASAMVGMSDSGQINVSNTISTRIQDNPLNDAGEAIVAPSPNQSNEPIVDSGLILADPAAQPNPPVTEDVTTGTTTEEGTVLEEASDTASDTTETAPESQTGTDAIETETDEPETIESAEATTDTAN